MTESVPQAPAGSIRPMFLLAILALGLGLRTLASLVVEFHAPRSGTRALCVFPDTEIYWRLAEAIRSGGPYVVMQWGVPHYALRAPGYPAFLAACQTLFGDATLPARLVQAVLGVACVMLTARLAGRVGCGDGPVVSGRKEVWTVPMIAVVLAAFDPFLVGISVLLLSEALFIPLMLAAQLGFSRIWAPSSEQVPARGMPFVAIGTGLATGAAVLTKPSWALFAPALLVAWWALSGGGARRRFATRHALFVILGIVMIMAPWWVRNARVCGRFVPTALWMGASLYDGLSHEATGASDMDFLNEAHIRAMDEPTQDAYLRDQALDFARQHPARVARLALIKAGRFWSPWPNADSLRPSPVVAWASSMAMIPLYALILLGAWDRRRDPRALILLAGPLLYFAAVHVVFVSSIRYRIPGEAAALGLAAIGARRLLEKLSRRRG